MILLPHRIREYLHSLYKRAETKDHQLLYLFLEITRLCNLSCKHCGSDCSSKERSSSLTTESWLRIIEDISVRFSPTPAIVLTGGEPILHPEFDVIIKSLNDHHFRWGAVSNGYTIDNKLITLLLRNNIHSITISLDGSEENHNWLRGKTDSFSQSINALKLLGETNIPMKDVVTCIYPRNIDELDAIAQILLSLNVTSWRLFRIFPAGRAMDNKKLQLSHSQTKRLIEWISRNKEEYHKKGLDINYSCEGWMPFPTDARIRNQPFFCRSGINIGAILCDGTITGCTNNSIRFFEGNVLNDSFPYIWESGFSQFRNRTWVQSTSCRECEYLKKCEGSSIHLWREDKNKPEFCYKDCFI